MNARSTRPQEILRIAVMTFVGAILMWVTAMAFDNDYILGRFITEGMSKEQFIPFYSFWATLVFVGSTISTILWYVLACITPNRGSEQNLSMRAPWAILSLIPLIITVIFVFVNQQKQVEWLCILFFLAIGCLGYLLSTALNSPHPFTYIPLLSRELRKIFKID